MSTSVSSVNPTAIQRMEGRNWYRFCIRSDASFKSGFFSCDDLERSMLHPQLRIIADELKLMGGVEKFHFNLGGESPDRLSVKFHDRIIVDDGVLMVIRDIIAERLG
ncbi:hypothetical protein H0X10_00690 [Candidatus Saccharibacteria bacterium]|nr:hypothetical protein [Candidatus Saccharibacteria bacterium]